MSTTQTSEDRAAEPGGDRAPSTAERDASAAEPSSLPAGGAGSSLAGKLAEVMGAIERVEKRGHNDHFGYDFATDADVKAAVRRELSQRRVAVLVSSRLIEIRDALTPRDKRTFLTDVEVSVTFWDAESGERETITAIGTGDDASDKGTYKAQTGGAKYALLATFLIPTGDDPENPGSSSSDASSGGDGSGEGSATRRRSRRASGATSGASGSQKKISEKQRGLVYGRASEHGLDNRELHHVLAMVEPGVVSVSDLSWPSLDAVLASFEQFGSNPERGREIIETWRSQNEEAAAALDEHLEAAAKADELGAGER